MAAHARGRRDAPTVRQLLRAPPLRRQLTLGAPPCMEQHRLRVSCKEVETFSSPFSSTSVLVPSSATRDITECCSVGHYSLWPLSGTSAQGVPMLAALVTVTVKFLLTAAHASQLRMPAQLHSGKCAACHAQRLTGESARRRWPASAAAVCRHQHCHVRLLPCRTQPGHVAVICSDFLSCMFSLGSVPFLGPQQCLHAHTQQY